MEIFSLNRCWVDTINVIFTHLFPVVCHVRLMSKSFRRAPNKPPVILFGCSNQNEEIRETLLAKVNL